MGSGQTSTGQTQSKVITDQQNSSNTDYDNLAKSIPSAGNGDAERNALITAFSKQAGITPPVQSGTSAGGSSRGYGSPDDGTGTPGASVTGAGGGVGTPATGLTSYGSTGPTNFSDSASVDAFIANMAKQPGVNPSVANDPNYWKGKILSGELGSDPNYITQKMMTPEGAGGSGGGSYSSTSMAGGLNFDGMNSAAGGINTNGGPSAYTDVALPTGSHINVDPLNPSAFGNLKSAITPTGLGDSAFTKLAPADFSGALAAYNDLIATGGVDTSKIQTAEDAFNKFTNSTGGYDPDQLAKIRGAADDLQNSATSNPGVVDLLGLAKTGGLTDQDYASVNRQSLLDIENNGGYSDKDIARVRQQAASAAPAFYSNLQDQERTARSTTGNLAGAGATDFKMARTAAQGSSADRLSAEIALQQNIEGNKSAAATTLSDANNKLLATRSATEDSAAANAGNIIETGTKDSADIRNDTEKNITGNQLTATNDQGQFILNDQDLIQKGKIAGAGGLETTTKDAADIADTRASGEDTFDINKADVNLKGEIGQNDFNTSVATGLDAYGFNKGRLQLDTGVAQNTNENDKAQLALGKAGGLDTYTNNQTDLALKKAGLEDTYGLGINSDKLQQAGLEDNYALGSRGLDIQASDVANRFSLGQQTLGLQTRQTTDQETQFGLKGLADLYGTSYGPGQTSFADALALANGKSGANIGYLGAENNNDASQKSAVPGMIASGATAAGNALLGGLTSPGGNNASNANPANGNPYALGQQTHFPGEISYGPGAPADPYGFDNYGDINGAPVPPGNNDNGYDPNDDPYFIPYE